VDTRLFKAVILIWLLGWGFVLTRFPLQGYRFLARGHTPTDGQLKITKFVGYIGLVFGGIFLIEIIFGVVR
jgi:hypothetical protein